MAVRRDPLARASEVFHALAHPIRLQLLLALWRGEECVCNLAALCNRPQPYVSQQLAELRRLGIVEDRREGQRIFYRLVDSEVHTILSAARLAPEEEAIAPLPSCRRSANE